jgi:NAD+ kinase
MFKAAIIAKPQKPEVANLLPGLIDWLREHLYEAILDEDCAGYLGQKGVKRADLPLDHPRLVIVLGGDGTLLSAARAFAGTGTPILSVNLGSLGFLTEIPLSDLYTTLEKWCEGVADIDNRFMMHCELYRGGRGSGEAPKPIREWDALNDVVVAKGTIARMADYTVSIDHQFVAAFRADGIIVSTPTGSTAYNLAANGPILMSSVSAMVVTPICPHLLTIRPIVVPAECTISIQIDGVPNQTYLTVDGQEAVELLLGDQVHCGRSQYSVPLLRLRPNGLFNVLRQKLKWGVR